jgi:hypothetical protein
VLATICDQLAKAKILIKFQADLGLRYWPLYGLIVAVRNDYIYVLYAHEYSLIYQAPFDCSTKECLVAQPCNCIISRCLPKEVVIAIRLDDILQQELSVLATQSLNPSSSKKKMIS